MKINGYPANYQIGGIRTTEGAKKTGTKDAQVRGTAFSDLLLHEKKVDQGVENTPMRSPIPQTAPVHASDWVKGLVADKGTAAHTTVYVSQSAFDKILDATTYKDRQPDWEEIGCDGSKKWVVINGQRFECPLSQAEKDKKKSLEDDLLDILKEHDKNRKPDKFKDPRGNIEALRGNEKVVQLLHRIFGTNSFDDLLTAITGTKNYYAYA